MAGMSPDRRSPAVFVVGCPRSGTTLLQRMLDHHPLLALANDTHFIPKAIDPDGGDVRLTAEVVDRVLSYHRFHRLGLTEESVRRAAAGAGTYAEFVGSLYEGFAAIHGKALGGEKTPDYVRHLPFLARLFPWARYVHLIRDGRDVALSAMQWATPTKGPGRFALWQEDPVAVCALWWRWQVTMGRADGNRLGSRYLELRYEDLVADPGPAIDRVSRHLWIPPSEAPLRFHVGRERADPGLSAKSAWLPPTSGLRDWRSEMDPAQVATFEVLAGDVLSELGYPRAGGEPSTAERGRAERFRRWWAAEQRRRRMNRMAAAG
jgi:Sulfotransferase family